MLATEMEKARAGYLYRFLIDEGYVKGTAMSHKAGVAASGKPQYVLSNDESVRQKMTRELFDPMTHISHHVS